ncbi:MAG: hypothetical protein RI958_2496 [Actinomycetota bacterium]
MRDGIQLARRDRAVVALVTEAFWQQGDLVALSNGMPDVPRLRLPHPVAGTGASAMAALAADLAPRLIGVLRGEASPDNPAHSPDDATDATDAPGAVGAPVEPDQAQARSEADTTLLAASDESEALELLHDLACTDGFPVIVPTRERVERLVVATGLDGSIDLGIMGPLGSATTIESVAVNAVMAGCLPDHMPIVVAGLRALLRPEFDLSEVQSTTHSVSPLVVVNGPVPAACGVASGFGALGPGHRANASIGRALRLCMINIGGARPGVSDMALLGHPGKFSMCLAEAEAESPWEPLSVAVGFEPSDSVVTVVGVEAPHSVVFVDDADDPDSAYRLLRAVAAVIATTGSNNAFFRVGSAAVLLNPEHAQVLARAGLGRREVQVELQRLATNRRGRLQSLNPMFVPRGDPDDEIHAIASPDHILVAVAGGGGLYSSVFPSWGAGAHACPILHERIETDQACELPARSSVGDAG